jgi:hypothetical protein
VSQGGLQQLLQRLLCVEADEIVWHVGIVAELLEGDLIALQAFRASRTARSFRSGFCEDTSLGQRVVDERAGNVTPRLSPAPEA